MWTIYLGVKGITAIYLFSQFEKEEDQPWLSRIRIEISRYGGEKLKVYT